MLGRDVARLPSAQSVSSPPKMFGRDFIREPSESVVSKPPKILGREDKYASGPLQSCPPKLFGRPVTVCARATKAPLPRPRMHASTIQLC